MTLTSVCRAAITPALLAITAVILAGCERSGTTAPRAAGPASESQQAPLPLTGPMMVRPVENLTFVDWRTPPVADGKGIAVISGDPATGPNILLHRFKRENPSTLHWHSSAYQAVVVQGTVKHWAQGGSEETAPPLRPGSYWFQPPNQMHADACVDASGECVIFLHTLGALDSTAAQPSPSKP